MHKIELSRNLLVVVVVVVDVTTVRVELYIANRMRWWLVAMMI